MAIATLAIGKFNSSLFGPDYHPAMGTVAERLREAMDRADIDQAALAARVGCTQGAISQILLGNTQRSRFLPDIADALGVSLAWLRGQRDDVQVIERKSVDTIAKDLGVKMVPRFNLGFSMGGGAVLPDHAPKDFYPFPRDWIRSLAKMSIDDLILVNGEGDSMMPTLLDGDLALIDTGQRQIDRQDRIWAISYGEMGVIKRVRRGNDGVFTLMSDNKVVDDMRLSEDEMHVVGRVVWIGRRI